jgi:hypothetical protein
MTLAEIRTAVMESLNQTSQEASDRIDRTINRKIREVQSSVRLALTRRAIASGTTSSGSVNMTVSGAKILSVYDKDFYKRPLGQVSLYTLRNMDADQDVEGPPYLWAEALRGATSTLIELYPKPTSDVAVLFFDILDNATDLSDDADEPAFPADFHDLLIDGVRYEELRKMEKMLPLATEAEKRFQRRISDLRYFIAKSAYLKTRQTDTYAEFGLSPRIWPYQNVAS